MSITARRSAATPLARIQLRARPVSRSQRHSLLPVSLTPRSQPPRSLSGAPQASHLSHLRQRRDIGPVGACVFGVLLVGLLASTSASAAGKLVSAVAVEETAQLDVVVTLDAAAAPTFQVYPSDDGGFTIEMPGFTLPADLTTNRQEGALIRGARIDADKSGRRRVVVGFASEVDYDAVTKGNQLVVTFTPLSSAQELKTAYATFLAERKAKKTEAERLAKAEADKQRLAAEQQRMAEEARKKAEEEKRRLAELERQRQAEEARKKAEEEERRLAELEKQRQEEEARKKAEEEKRRLAEIERKRKEEEARKRIEEEQRRLAELEKQRLEEEARRKAEEEKRRLAELERQRKEAEAKKRAEEEKRRLAELEKQRLEEEARQKAEAEKRRLAELEKQRLEEEARQKAEAEKRRLAELEKQRLEEEAKKKAKAEAEAEQRRLAEVERQRKQEEAKKKAEDEKRRLAELEKQRLQEQARQAAAEAQRKAEQEEQRLAERRRQAEEAERRRRDQEQRFAGGQADQDRAARLKALFDQAQREREAALAAQRGRYRGDTQAPVTVASVEERGFGGTSQQRTSVDIAPDNLYQLADGPARSADEFGGSNSPSGLLSHITVERQEGHSSRVGVRVDGGARFHVKRASDKELILTLFDTGAANLNVRRILDATDLRTNVLRVLPRVVEDDGARVDLVIELRESAPIQVSTDDAMLWLHVG